MFMIKNNYILILLFLISLVNGQNIENLNDINKLITKEEINQSNIQNNSNIPINSLDRFSSQQSVIMPYSPTELQIIEDSLLSLYYGILLLFKDTFIMSKNIPPLCKIYPRSWR